MKTNVKCNELKELSSFVSSKKEELDLVFQDISKTIDSVSTAWSGKDCKEFIEEAQEKIETEKNNNNKLKTFADNLKTASEKYANFESKWAEEAKRES